MTRNTALRLAALVLTTLLLLPATGDRQFGFVGLFMLWGLTTDSVKSAIMEQAELVERTGCWRIPRLRLAKRGAVSWQDGGERSNWQ